MKTIRLLFNDDMARAIVEGRKTVTRRPAMGLHGCAVNPALDLGGVAASTGIAFFDMFGRTHEYARTPCAPGDLLIGRECWADVNSSDGPAFLYRSGGFRFCSEDAFPVEYERYPSCTFSMWHTDLLRGEQGHRWRPSIHMPDWAARIRRRVLGVTVERVQDITEEDAMREGIRRWTKDGSLYKYGHVEPGDIGSTPWVNMARSATDAFARLWDRIYGERCLGWSVNPWVWRIEFSTENVEGEK